MKKFKDFGIKVSTQNFTGEKIKISKILNKEVQILGYKIGPSKYAKEAGDKCLHLSIQFGGKTHLVFTGSKYLIEGIQQVPQNEFPFEATIIEENESYQFE